MLVHVCIRVTEAWVNVISCSLHPDDTWSAAEERARAPDSLQCQPGWLPGCEEFLAALRTLGLQDGSGDVYCTPAVPVGQAAASAAKLCLRLLLKALPVALRAQVRMHSLV